jgi:hypothetical protein
MDSPPTLTVHEKATIQQQPSELMMVAEVTASGQTLELALKLLQKKRDAVSAWMDRLGAKEVRFGAARFPDQVVPDATRMIERVQQRVRRQMSMSLPAEPATEPGRNVGVCFAATWSIEGMTSDEVLILADRIQLEATDADDKADADPQAAEERWTEDPIGNIQSVLTDLWQPIEGNEPYFLFMSQLTEEHYLATLTEAFRKAEQEARLLARAVGKELGELSSVHSATQDWNAQDHVRQYQRVQHTPILAEVPVQTGRFQQVSESPKAAEFTVSIHVTYTLK